ncbi:terpene synthase family protein [Pseudomonas sp. FP1740]|uniref:terpene synthase family protein n=1 Tax=Pseudomonas sp. FP1740 TaxID=2954078 RepID=UPI002734BB49|nr:terpene synthase family protein [Pseudomonas sp. FP1740]WLG46840.1 terpene synthase family protein [Pseudomonas sp. FP1740]
MSHHAFKLLGNLKWGDVPPINTHHRHLIEQEHRWLTSLGINQDGPVLARYKKINVPLLAAMTHQCSTVEGLSTAHRFLSWLFILDDQFDESSPAKNYALLQVVVNNVKRVLAGEPVVEHSHAGLFRGLADVWSDLACITSPHWQSRFTQHIIDFLDAYAWECDNRRDNRVPSVEEYLAWRQATGAVLPCFDLLIPTLGIELDELDFSVHELGVLEFLACEIITLSNDLVSYHKEIKAQDFHNLVTIYTRDGFSTQSAMERVVQKIELDIAEFDRVAKLQLSVRPNVNLVRYISGLKNWTTSNFYWSTVSARYSLDF